MTWHVTPFFNNLIVFLCFQAHTDRAAERGGGGGGGPGGGGGGLLTLGLNMGPGPPGWSLSFLCV